MIVSLQKLIKDFDRQIEKPEQRIEMMIEKDAALQKKVDQITSSIKGLGIKTVVTIIAETDGFSMINNHRQLTSYAGYDVVENQSGKRVGKTKIFKKGNSHIRKAFYTTTPAASESKEAKLFFPLGFEKAEKKVAPNHRGYTRWTSDTISAEALFPLEQS